MTTALTAAEPVSAAQGAGFTREQKDLIKRSLFKDSTDDEFAYFIATAQRLRLDPFAKQIFAVKRGGTTTIQVSIDGFRLVAERTGYYAPGRRTEFEYDDNGKLVRAIAYVKKFACGDWHEVPEEASWSEFAQNTPPWARMPRVMLSKCAEARALRRAFPAELSGVYAPEEMDQADHRAPAQDADVDAEVIDELAWQLKVSATENVDDLRAMRIDFDELPDCAAKVRIADLISKRRSALARQYADALAQKGAVDAG
jgi:phage recombination protein Bet